MIAPLHWILRARRPQRSSNERHPILLKQALSKHTALLWYIGILIIYTILALAALVYATTCPKTSPNSRVLNTGSATINTLSSSVVLAVIISPAAILIRKICYEISLLHPFAIASKNAVSIVDFESMADPGIGAIRTTVKYSSWRALVQLVLTVAGWVLVPVGLLIVTSGQYLPQAPGTAMVPMPTLNNTADLSTAMNPFAGNGPFEPALNGSDQFLGITAAAYQGSLVNDRNIFQLIPTEIGTLPPTQTSFLAGVTYENIVTYNWTGNCQDASSSISYAIDEPNALQRLNFTFPRGQFETVTFNPRNYSATAQLFMYSDSTNISSGNIPNGGTTYFAIGILEGTPISSTYNTALGGQAFTPGLLLDQGIWIVRVSCQPTLRWRIATCTWDGSFMRNCTGPGETVTGLDTNGLDALGEYMTAVQWQLYNDHNMFYVDNPFPGIVPTLENFEGVTGVIAYSIVAVASNPAFGTARVDTIGQPLKWVYVVRLDVLAIVAVMLMTAAIVAVGSIVHDVVRRIPLRKTTFLAVAGAVRGDWWNELLRPGGEMNQKRLSYVGSRRVKLVADEGGGGYLALVPVQEHASPARAELGRRSNRWEMKASVVCYELDQSSTKNLAV